jgi:hypothetical protein
MKAAVEFVVNLERELLASAARASLKRIDQLLDAGFIEFGKSGNIWRKSDILDALPQETASEAGITREMADISVQHLGEHHIWLAYKACVIQSGEMIETSLRSSIWQYNDGNWCLIFHQGTACRD